MEYIFLVQQENTWLHIHGTGNGNVNARYYDLYANGNLVTSTKIGDALGTATSTNPGCNGWHSSSASSEVKFPMLRDSAGIFSTSFIGGWNPNNPQDGNGFARGVAVCGEGL